MSFFLAMDVVASSLGAQRFRMEAVASNLANAGTTRIPEVARVTEDTSAPRLRHAPGHPDADP